MLSLQAAFSEFLNHDTVCNTTAYCTRQCTFPPTLLRLFPYEDYYTSKLGNPAGCAIEV
jgi:hypothetical protein